MSNNNFDELFLLWKLYLFAETLYVDVFFKFSSPEFTETTSIDWSFKIMEVLRSPGQLNTGFRKGQFIMEKKDIIFLFIIICLLILTLDSYSEDYTGVWHVVKNGETLPEIAAHYTIILENLVFLERCIVQGRLNYLDRSSQ